MSQIFRLGAMMRDRYLDQVQSPDTFISGISTRYDSADYLFRSSAVDRTVQSAWSASMALFPSNGPLNDITGVMALPNRTQAVPILSNAVRNDVIFRGYEGDKCPILNTRYANKLSTQAVKDLAAKYQPFMDQMYEVSGSPYAKDFSNFYSTLFCFLVWLSFVCLFQ